MTARSRSKLVVFSHPFELKGVDRILPPGDYRVVTDEVLIEELSFPVYRRISTMIFLPGQGRQASSLEMMTIDPRDLEAAQDRDQYNESTTAGECEQAGDRTIDLDQPRGMVAQMWADLRRLLGMVRAPA